jgi:hypothetical protein
MHPPQPGSQPEPSSPQHSPQRRPKVRWPLRLPAMKLPWLSLPQRRLNLPAPLQRPTHSPPSQLHLQPESDRAPQQSRRPKQAQPPLAR